MAAIERRHPGARLDDATRITSPFGWFLKVRASFDASSEEAAEIAHSLYGAALKGSIFTRREIDWSRFEKRE